MHLQAKEHEYILQSMVITMYNTIMQNGLDVLIG